MNIVIPLLSQLPRNKDIELKYALRSMPEHENVYVIGRKPPNFQRLIHIPFQDKADLRFKHENIYRKCIEAFKYMDKLIFANDDHYVLPGFDVNQYYYQGELKDKLIPSTSEDYKASIRNTITYLEERNLPTKYFDVHCPIIYEKEKFPVITNHVPFGFCLKSLYCNLNGIEGTPCIDIKIRELMKKEWIMNIIQGKLFFSSIDDSVNASFLDVLSSLFAKESRYELPAFHAVR